MEEIAGADALHTRGVCAVGRPLVKSRSHLECRGPKDVDDLARVVDLDVWTAVFEMDRLGAVIVDLLERGRHPRENLKSLWILRSAWRACHAHARGKFAPSSTFLRRLAEDLKMRELVRCGRHRHSRRTSRCEACRGAAQLAHGPKN